MEDGEIAMAIDPATVATAISVGQSLLGKKPKAPSWEDRVSEYAKSMALGNTSSYIAKAREFSANLARLNPQLAKQFATKKKIRTRAENLAAIRGDTLEPLLTQEVLPLPEYAPDSSDGAPDSVLESDRDINRR